MSFHEVYAEGSVTEQGRIKSYGIDLKFNLGGEVKLDFTSYLSKPKEKGQRATLDSFNEHMRDECFAFMENNNLFAVVDGKEVELHGAHLYNSVMQMIVDSISTMNEKGEPMFIAKVDDKELRQLKKRRKTKIQEAEKVKEDIRNYELQIIKISAKKEAMAEVLKEYNIGEPTSENPLVTSKTTKTTKTTSKTTKKDGKPRKYGKKAETEMSEDAVKHLF